MQKMKELVCSLDEEVVVERKLIALGMVTAFFGGMIIGLLCAPCRSVIFSGTCQEDEGKACKCRKDKK